MMFRFRIRIFLTLLLFVCAKYAYPQANINSPYSRYGVGDIQPTYFEQSIALGGSATAMREYNTINYFNPASYSAVYVTTFSTGVAADLITLHNSAAFQTGFAARLSYLAMAFPLKSSKWGLSLGLLPFSNMGYNQTLSLIDKTLGPESAIYSGQGGLTAFYGGTGYNITKNLSVGVNLSYVFGNIQQVQALEFANSVGTAGDTIYNSRVTTTNQLGGFLYGYGIQYTMNLSKESKLTVGYSGSYRAAIHSRELQAITRYSSNSKTNLDTSNYIDNGKEIAVLPSTNNFGITYKYGYKWLVTGDFKTGNWSIFRINDVPAGFRNSWQASIGTQFTPDPTSVSNYLSLIDYRVGFNYGETYLNITSTPVNQVAATFGVGLPIRGGGGYNPSQTGAKLNLSLEIGQKGTVTSTTVRENFVNLHVGFVLNSQWFYRRRYQ